MAANVTEAVRSALGREPRIDLVNHPIAMNYDGRDLTLEGEVPSVAAKKLALELAAAVPGVTDIVDRLHVTPAERMGDGRIGELLRDALLQENAFADFALWGSVAGRPAEMIRNPTEPAGRLDFSVEDGIVVLNGRVPGLDHKRLAGVLAWWIPGSRDVVNGITVEPEEADSDEKLAEAVRLALEKDPFVDAKQIRVTAKDSVITLDGLVPSESEADMAEMDAWYVFAVDRAINRIEVRH